MKISWATIILLVISCAGCSRQPGPLNSAAVESRFHFESNKQGIFLPISFRGKEYLFLLDTGSSWMVYDESFRPLLGAPVKREVVRIVWGRQETNDFFKAPDARLGKMSLATTEPVFCDDFSPYRQASGTQLYGAIGMTFLRRHALYLDFDANEVRFLNIHSSAKIVDPGETILSTLNAWITLPTGQEKVIIDSGTWEFGAIAASKFDELVRLKKIEITGTNEIIRRGMPEVFTTGHLQSFTFMEEEFRDATFNRSGVSRLGWAFMTNYNWLLDFPHDLVGTGPRSHN